MIDQIKKLFKGKTKKGISLTYKKYLNKNPEIKNYLENLLNENELFYDLKHLIWLIVYDIELSKCKTCGNEFEYHRKRKNCLKCTPARRTFESEEERLIETRKRRVADVKRRRHKVKNMSLEYKGNKCCICGYDKCKDALDFHHLDPTKKDFGIGENGYTRA